MLPHFPKTHAFMSEIRDEQMFEGFWSAAPLLREMSVAVLNEGDQLSFTDEQGKLENVEFKYAKVECSHKIEEGRGLSPKEFFERAREPGRRMREQIPADFGIDIIVTNQFRAARGLKDDLNRFPFGLQVKSRWLKESHVSTGPNGRPETTVDFSLKAEELEVLLKQETTGIVFVTFWPGAEQQLRPRLFWLDADNLEDLKTGDFSGLKGRSFLLTIRYRVLPRTQKEDLLEEIVKSFNPAQELVDKLTKELPGVFQRNWNATDLQFALPPTG
jgi:hypothetical protein